MEFVRVRRSMPLLSRSGLALLVGAVSWMWLTSGSAAADRERELSDAHIAAIVLAANTIDIRNGALAATRTKNRAVKDFARQMVADHTSVNARATALAARLKLTPVEGTASQSLVADADATRSKLRKLKGAAFDRAYVDNEVAYHQAVLDLLDRTLIPSAENQELEDLLKAVRPAFVAHLEHARHLQATLR